MTKPDAAFLSEAQYQHDQAIKAFRDGALDLARHYRTTLFGMMLAARHLGRAKIEHQAQEMLDRLYMLIPAA